LGLELGLETYGLIGLDDFIISGLGLGLGLGLATMGLDYISAIMLSVVLAYDCYSTHGRTSAKMVAICRKWV